MGQSQTRCVLIVALATHRRLSFQCCRSQFWSQLSPDTGVCQRSRLARLCLMPVTAVPSDALATTC